MENLSKGSLLAIKEIIDIAVGGLRGEMDDKFDLVRQEIRATKTELRQEIHLVKSELIHEIADTEGRLMGALSDTYDSLLKPRLDNHERRITKLETKVA